MRACRHVVLGARARGTGSSRADLRPSAAVATIVAALGQRARRTAVLLLGVGLGLPSTPLTFTPTANRRRSSARPSPAKGKDLTTRDLNWQAAVGQRRLLDLAAWGEVLDDNLDTTPGRFGGGGAGTTGLVGSAEDVARSLRKYQALGITHFALSGTPYPPEIKRQGDQLLPLLRG